MPCKIGVFTRQLFLPPTPPPHYPSLHNTLNLTNNDFWADALQKEKKKLIYLSLYSNLRPAKSDRLEDHASYEKGKYIQNVNIKNSKEFLKNWLIQKYEWFMNLKWKHSLLPLGPEKDLKKWIELCSSLKKGTKQLQRGASYGSPKCFGVIMLWFISYAPILKL